MNRISRILGTPSNKTAARHGNRSFFSGAIALLLVTVGLTTLGAGCVNNSAAETITREDYGRIAMEMRGAVDSGWLSEEEMTAKLGELRKQIVPGSNDDRRAFREQIGARLDAIEEMVANGEMSREDADRNIAVIRRRIAARQSEQEEESRTFTRADYARTKKKLDGMVAAGDVSQEDADIRLSRMRSAIATDRKEQSKESKTLTRAEYARAKKKIDGMVAAGEVSREDADTRLGQMRRMIATDRPEQGGETRTFTREEYAAAETKIKAMVAEGKVSQEDADRRLGRMRLMIATDRRESGEVNWDGLKRRIEGAAEAADLTDEALEGIKKRIEGAVEAGGMTREEADALYEKLEKFE